MSEQTEFDQIHEEYETAIRINPFDADAHFHYAHYLSNQNRLDEACRHYDSALEIDPNNAETHHGFARVLTKQGRTNEAREHYQIALNLDPNSARAASNLARLSLVGGNVARGLDHALHALRIGTLPNNGVEIVGWFGKHAAKLEQIARSPGESTDRRGSALALLITNDPQNAPDYIDRCQTATDFPSVGRVCSDILNLWTPQDI